MAFAILLVNCRDEVGEEIPPQPVYPERSAFYYIFSPEKNRLFCHPRYGYYSTSGVIDDSYISFEFTKSDPFSGISLKQGPGMKLWCVDRVGKIGDITDIQQGV